MPIQVTPAEVRSVSTEESRDLRWNFSAAVIDAAGWGVGTSLISATTILPLYVRELTPSPIAVGMIQAVMLFGWLAPGILVSGHVERFPRVKPSVMWIAALERAMLLLMAWLTLRLGHANRPALLLAFFACWGIMNGAVGANTPGYYKLIAKTIPAIYRGRLYGVGGAISGLLGVAAGALATWLLANWGFPRGFAACFLAAFVTQGLSVLPLGFMRETRQAPEHTPPHVGPREALGLLRQDRSLLWICLAVSLFSINVAAGGFYAVYAADRFGAGTATVAGFTAIVMGARTGAYLLIGWIGDRFGNRVAMGASSLFGIAAALLAWRAPSLGWLYVVFVLNEFAVQGWGVCSINYVLELCPPERSSTYTAVFALVTGPFRVGLPLVGGAVIVALGYPMVFLIAAVGGITALEALRSHVPEPRHNPAPNGSL